MSAKATGVVIGKDGCERDVFQGNEILTVAVQDTSRMGAPAITLGKQRICLQKGDQFPVNFTVGYNEEEASQLPDYGFTLCAAIENDQGTLLYVSDTRTSARDKQVEVIKI